MIASSTRRASRARRATPSWPSPTPPTSWCSTGWSSWNLDRKSNYSICRLIDIFLISLRLRYIILQFRGRIQLDHPVQGQVLPRGVLQEEPAPHAARDTASDSGDSRRRRDSVRPGRGPHRHHDRLEADWLVSQAKIKVNNQQGVDYYVCCLSDLCLFFSRTSSEQET